MPFPGENKAETSLLVPKSSAQLGEENIAAIRNGYILNHHRIIGWFVLEDTLKII